MTHHQMTDLAALAEAHLEQARTSSAGRSSDVVTGTHGTLKQLLLALTEGSALSEHDNPGEATLLVLAGSVTLRTADRSYAGDRGSYLLIPDERHDLVATTDAAVLLTFVKPPHPEERTRR
ncbi:cupin domain-containing protein [Janibacter alkaliphilus]|uniref:Quercetin dioxygenase-like cupin family protein n=1 Tax=Janibacter alkaliphilus TaxID=1069963 RepID=A0A852X2H3_9MICO|nr:quercetin dioxygenase-like cupin family protein [Janibacter alkaliphilus]